MAITEPLGGDWEVTSAVLCEEKEYMDSETRLLDLLSGWVSSGKYVGVEALHDSFNGCMTKAKTAEAYDQVLAAGEVTMS